MMDILKEMRKAIEEEHKKFLEEMAEERKEMEEEHKKFLEEMAEKRLETSSGLMELEPRAEVLQKALSDLAETRKRLEKGFWKTGRRQA
jgi:predicted RecB family endonuclease